MTKNKQRIPEELQRWIEARRRFRLSDAHVQMARELGMNPRKLGSLANHRQERWKAPLPLFIEHLYQKRFGKARPDRILSIEGRVREIAAKKAERRERRRRVKVPHDGGENRALEGHERHLAHDAQREVEFGYAKPDDKTSDTEDF
jgi:hypothetical protein